MTTAWCLTLLSLWTATWSAPSGSGAGDPAASEAHDQAPTIREFTLRARRYRFDPARIEVNRGDIVKITLIAEDVPHSFTIDEYRICKRVSPDKSVKVEFYADKAGTFVYYCSLIGDEGCRDMRGTLVVR